MQTIQQMKMKKGLVPATGPSQLGKTTNLTNLGDNSERVNLYTDTHADSNTPISS